MTLHCLTPSSRSHPSYSSMNSYFLWQQGQWWWWSRSLYTRWVPTGREPNDGGRYPVVILTEDSFKYAIGKNKLKEPPQDSSTGHVISIKDMQQWQSHWDGAAPYNKLLVYEFYEKNSTLCKAMDKPFEELAKQYKGKADFCKLDVDNFEFLARLCGVEGAYPTFVLFKNGKQVGKVVGLKEDELERSIQRALSF